MLGKLSGIGGGSCFQKRQFNQVQNLNNWERKFFCKVVRWRWFGNKECGGGQFVSTKKLYL
jgi:hypothetical protein